MQSLEKLNQLWADAIRAYAHTELTGDEGNKYKPIGNKSMRFLEALWTNSNGCLPDIGKMILAGKIVKFGADYHLGHDNIRKYAERVQFESVEHMDTILTDNISRAMADSDLVVCVGDLRLKESITEHKRLRREFGDRHLMVIGNHDPKGSQPQDWVKTGGALASIAFTLPGDLLERWSREDHPDEAAFVDWRALPNHVNFGVCHWPLQPDAFPGPDWICLHGHIHNRASGELRANCSVEVINYQPATLRELISPELLDDLIHRVR